MSARLLNAPLLLLLWHVVPLEVQRTPLGHARSNTYLSLFGFVGGIAETHAIGSVGAGLFIQP